MTAGQYLDILTDYWLILARWSGGVSDFADLVLIMMMAASPE